VEALLTAMNIIALEVHLKMEESLWYGQIRVRALRVNGEFDASIVSC
jgi:hypothetical protein